VRVTPDGIVLYALPFGREGRGGSGNPVVAALVKGWQVANRGPSLSACATPAP